MEKQPRIGVAVIIKKGNQVLFGERKGSHGAGTWSIPGGHLEFGESIQECALREVAEENGVTISNVKFLDFTEDYFTPEEKHYVTMYLVADYVSGEPQNLEPEKCNGWKWLEWNIDTLPKNIFLPIENLFKKRNIL